MISRKWLYTYRMLTARLHEEEQAPRIKRMYANHGRFRSMMS